MDHLNNLQAEIEWDFYDGDSGYDSNSDAESEADSGYYDSD